MIKGRWIVCLLLLVLAAAGMVYAQATVGAFRVTRYTKITTVYRDDRSIRMDVTGQRVLLERTDGSMQMTAPRFMVISRPTNGRDIRLDNATASGKVTFLLKDAKDGTHADGQADTVEFIDDLQAPRIVLTGNVNVSVKRPDMTASQRGASGVVHLRRVGSRYEVSSVVMEGGEDQTEATYTPNPAAPSR